jgi:tetratricopeptide (TPR) repeat protein
MRLRSGTPGLWPSGRSSATGPGWRLATASSGYSPNSSTVPDEAAEWYARSQAIRQELGDRPGLADSYHQLGMVAQDQGRLDEAAEWYARALAIREELGNRPGLAASYGQLGLLAEQQHSPGRALEWMVRCVALFDEFPYPSTGSGPDYLARLARQLGIKELEARWRKVTGRRLPRAVRDYVDVRAYRPGSRRHSRRSR